MCVYLCVLVEEAYELVSGVKNIPPVKGRLSRFPPLLRPSVQEVQDVSGGETRIPQTLVQKLHHCWVSQSVLKQWPDECREEQKHVAIKKLWFSAHQLQQWKKRVWNLLSKSERFFFFLMHLLFHICVKFQRAPENVFTFLHFNFWLS